MVFRNLEVDPSDPARRRILVATLMVIAEHGLDAVRHRGVAELAGVSLGSTTYHFRDRDELVREAFALYLDEAAATVHQLLATPSHPDPVDSLLELVLELYGYEFEDPPLVLAEYELILHAARDPALGERFRAWEATQRSAIAGVLVDAGAPDPDGAAATLVALLRGMEVEALVAGPIDAETMRRRLAPVLDGLARR